MPTTTLVATPDPDDGRGKRSKRRPGKRNVNGEGSIYQRKDGRWEAKVFVTTPDGLRKRVSVYGDSWEEANNERTRLQDQERRGLPAVTTTMTVGEYMTYWLHEVARPSVRRTTYATYEGAVRLHIVPGIGKRKLKTLQASHIRTWLNGLRKQCQCCAQEKDVNRAAQGAVKARCCARSPQECCGDVLSASSIRHLLRVLRAALQDAVDEDLISRNVARLVQLRVTDHHKVRAFSKADAKRFLKVAREHRLYALWAVALAMGLRRGEALGLAWDDIDLEAGRLTIRQALHRVDGQLRLDPVKTEGSVATLPLPRPLVPVLREHRKRQIGERFEAAGARWHDKGLVFTTASGNWIEPRNINRMFERLCEKAQVPRVRVHDLRHSCATLL